MKILTSRKQTAGSLTGRIRYRQGFFGKKLIMQVEYYTSSGKTTKWRDALIEDIDIN